MASELEQALIAGGYAEADAATIEGAAAGVVAMNALSAEDQAALRGAVQAVALANSLDADSVHTLSRVYPMSRAMLHRRFKTDAAGIEAMLAKGAIPIERPVILAWFGAIGRSTQPTAIPAEQPTA